MSCDIFILVGEASGDAHGALIIDYLLKKRPQTTITAVAGPKMRKYPIDCAFPMEKLQVMGFIDVFLSFPFLLRFFFQVRKRILETNPKQVLFIDYPGLHLRLARSLRKKGYKGKISHYICPSVWAWGKKRIPLMAKHLDQLFSIFPFEKQYFSQTKLSVHYVGNPLVSPLLKKTIEKKYLTIFPGSRKKELEKNLKLQLVVGKKLLLENKDLKIALSLSHEMHRAFVEKSVKEAGIEITIFSPEDKEHWLKKTFVALATSGTITLELALQQIPTVVNYAIRPLDEFIALNVFRIRLPSYCLVNIISEKRVFPEFFGHELTVDGVYRATKEFIESQKNREKCSKECSSMRKSFGNKQAEEEVCRQLLNLF